MQKERQIKMKEIHVKKLIIVKINFAYKYFLWMTFILYWQMNVSVVYIDFSLV